MSEFFRGFDEIKDGEPVDDISDLSEIYNAQLTLMEKMDYKRFPKDLYFLLTAQNLQGEIVEATEFFGDITKPWKEKYDVDLDAVREEWIDVLFFWMQGAIVLGLVPEEILGTYLYKFSKNMRRIAVKLGEAQ